MNPKQKLKEIAESVVNNPAFQEELEKLYRHLRLKGYITTEDLDCMVESTKSKLGL